MDLTVEGSFCGWPREALQTSQYRWPGGAALRPAMLLLLSQADTALSTAALPQNKETGFVSLTTNLPPGLPILNKRLIKN